MAQIVLDGIAHAYSANPRGPQDYALKPLNHTWENGGAYALLGPSGCGKTTLLNIISGLITPSEGRVLFDGRDVTDLPTAERNIAQVFQFPVIYDTMTVAQNLAFPLRNRQRPGERGRRGASREIAAHARPDADPEQEGARPHRRREAEGVARPRPGSPGRLRHPLRRAAHRHRPASQVAAPLEAEGAAPRARPHHGLRHARPDRGADLRRHGGGDVRRRGRADRHAGGSVRAARPTPSSATSSARPA